MNSENVETFEEVSYEHEEENNGDPTMVSLIVKENPYIRNIINNSKLYIVHKKNVIEAFDTFGPSGLFHLFLPKDFFAFPFAIGQMKNLGLPHDLRNIFLKLRYLL